MSVDRRSLSADRVAELAPLIREVFSYTGEDGTVCATFEVVGVNNAWAQVTPTQLNIAYPSKLSPDAELGDIVLKLPGATLQEWEAEKCATWSFISTNPYELARVVDLVLVKLFGLGEYGVDCRMEYL